MNLARHLQRMQHMLEAFARDDVIEIAVGETERLRVFDLEFWPAAANVCTTLRRGDRHLGEVDAHNLSPRIFLGQPNRKVASSATDLQHSLIIQVRQEPGHCHVPWMARPFKGWLALALMFVPGI